MKNQNIAKSPVYVALNMFKVANNEKSLNLMQKVGK